MKNKSIIPILLAIVILLVNNLPFIVPSVLKKDRLIFLGRHAVNSQDTYTYLSFIEQARQGRYLFKNLYTAGGQTPHFIHPLYLGIGIASNVLHISSIVAYHAARIILSILFLIVLYRFLGVFFPLYETRIVAYLIVLTSSGLGYLFSTWLPDASDLWIPESITFLSLMEAPHFILSLILIVIVVWKFLTIHNNNEIYQSVGIGIALLILSFEHPFTFIPIGLTLLVSGLFLKRNMGPIIGALLIGSVGLVYQAWIVFHDPIMKAWLNQNALPSPIPINYIVGYGGILLFALVGSEIVLRRMDEFKDTSHFVFLLTWAGITAILVYAPVIFQRRFIEGLHIPLSILATFGIIAVKNFLEKNKKRVLVSVPVFTGGMVLFLALSSIAYVVREVQTINLDSYDGGYYYYVAPEEMRAMVWLREHIKDDDVILSNWFYGNLIPGLTGRRVFIGHKIQTPNFDENVSLVNAFLLETNHGKSLQFLSAHSIRYIFLGINDTILQYGFKPSEKPYLTLAHQDGGVSIYKVTPHD